MSNLYHLQHREHCNQTSLNYYYTHKEDRLKKAKAWRDNHKEHRANYGRLYRLNNPERVAYHKSIRKDRIRGLQGKHTFEEWQELKAKYGFKCAMCRKQEPSIKLTRDHIEPVKLGGSNDISNIQPLCAKCNSWKRLKNWRFLNPVLMDYLFGKTGLKDVPLNQLRD